MNLENDSLQFVDSPNSENAKRRIIPSYILVGLGALLIPTALFSPAFLRLEENPDSILKDPIPVVETFWQFSIIASILMIALAIGAVTLLVIKRPRKLIYIALVATLVCFGASYLHERAKQDKYLSYGGYKSDTPSDIARGLDKFTGAINNLKRVYIESEVYGRAWTFMFIAVLSFWISGLLQFNKIEYQRAWNWALSKVPIFEQKFKPCQSCGKSNFLEASRCKYCDNPFVSI